MHKNKKSTETARDQLVRIEVSQKTNLLQIRDEIETGKRIFFPLSL